MHAGPSLESPAQPVLVGKVVDIWIPEGTQLEVYARTASRSVVGGVSDYWYAVVFEFRSPRKTLSWVFGSYLK